jgi:hypothetical protein
MDDISEFLLGGQRSPGSMSGIALAIVAGLLASALLGYLVWCYMRERRIERRIKQRKERQCGGNIVPPEQMLAETNEKNHRAHCPPRRAKTAREGEFGGGDIRGNRFEWMRRGGVDEGLEEVRK